MSCWCSSTTLSDVGSLCSLLSWLQGRFHPRASQDGGPSSSAAACQSCENEKEEKWPFPEEPHVLLRAKSIVTWPHKDTEEAERFSLCLFLPLTFGAASVALKERSMDVEGRCPPVDFWQRERILFCAQRQNCGVPFGNA